MKFKNAFGLPLSLCLATIVAFSFWGCKKDSSIVRGKPKISNPEDYTFGYPALAEYHEYGNVSPIIDSSRARDILRLDSLAALEVSQDLSEKNVGEVAEPSLAKNDKKRAYPIRPKETIEIDSLALEPAPTEVSLCGEVGENEICDVRDGKHYDFVVIGRQTWFRRNLAYEIEGSWCPGGKEENCAPLGRLYQWNSASSCPEGWRLPSMRDFKILYEYAFRTLGSKEGVGTSLKTIVGWNEDDDIKVPPGTNRFGFGAKPAGYRDVRGNYLSIGDEANFWTSDQVNGEDRASYWNLYYANQDFIGSYVGPKSVAMSVRCIKG